MEKKQRGSFSSGLGFVLAAAGSAVGLGNIWRFPYLAAQDGGGIFLLTYLILTLTFGFSLLTTEIAIGRKTRQSPLTAYGSIRKGWGPLGIFASLVPFIIMPYYSVIGGWVMHYFVAFISGNMSGAATDGYFTGFITDYSGPLIYMIIFLSANVLIVFLGVDKGIERCSRILMPMLFIMIIGISVFSITLHHTDDSGITRSGLEGLSIYVIPDFKDLSFTGLLRVISDAMSQMFYSLSVAMGIMVAYGSYMKDDVDMSKSINQIEIFDTLVAFLAGVMIIPAVFVFSGREGMSAGPSLMFITLPKVFNSMGQLGAFVGLVFFLLVFFAALTSSVSILEAIVSSVIDKFSFTRKKAVLICSACTFVLAIIVCLGYNALYFELPLPNGSVAQVLDVMDYLSNSVLMPIVAIAECVLIGWIMKPEYACSEMEKNGKKFIRKPLYIVMVRFIAPFLLFVMLLQSLGIIK
ncbi:MAG: sodium-dependent transporter [Lachnospiraceae bacterium]|nr:sodium-dependent transporter [Lachnospiraceae bacterium]